MESLQNIEFFEELSDEQLMSISGGVGVSSSSDLGSLDLSSCNGVITFQSNSSAGTGTTIVDLNNLTITTKRPGVTDTTIQLK